MRYRERDSRTEMKVNLLQENVAGLGLPNSTIFQLHQNARYYGELLQTWDVVTPGYYKLRRRGELITNPYKNVRTTRFDSTTGASARGNFPTPPNPPDYFMLQDVSGPHLHGMMNDVGLQLRPQEVISRSTYGQLMATAATKAHAGVGHGDTELLVLFAELKKTFLTLLNPLNNLRRLFDQLNRSRAIAGSTLSLADYMAKEWLKIRYGIIPILMDIEGILKALSRDTQKGQHSSRGREIAKEERLLPPSVWPHGDFDTTYQDTYTDEVVIKCGLIYNAKLGKTDYLGVNLRSIPSAAWELIPWSFVVDWFFNVQHYIRAMTAAGEVPKGGAYTVVTRTLTASRAILSSEIVRNTANSSKIRGMTGTETIVMRSKTREPFVLAPSLVSKIDSSLFEWKDKRVLDALALAFGQIHRR
jgi:hypothetical protein